MRGSQLFGERVGRILPPVLLFLVLVLSSLPFTGVSLDAGALRAVAHNPLSPQQLTPAESACIDALGNKVYLAYSTFDLVTGTEPAEDNSRPAECSGVSTVPASSADDASHFAIGIQPLAAISAGLLLIALALSLMRSPLRGAVVAPLLLLVLMLLGVEQIVATSAILGVLPSGAQSVVDITAQAGYPLTLVLIAVTALYMAIHALLAQRRSRPG